MAAIKIAQGCLTKKTISAAFLKDLFEKDFISDDLRQAIMEDEDLKHYFAPKKKAKKSSEKKSSGSKKISDLERNSLGYDQGRCCARVWKAEEGLGYDNIQCTSKNFVSPEDAIKVLKTFDMDEEKASTLDDYVAGYNGCFCKKHLSMDFFMPNGYWLGKVNEPRPEEPKLPKGSVKKGFTEEYKEHKWMIDSQGEKVEPTKKKRSPKKSIPSQFRGMKVSELKKKARELEVGEDQITEADDSDNVKASLILLIQEKEVPEEEEKAPKEEEKAPEEEEKAPEEEVNPRSELETMKVSSLKKKAKEIGVSEEELEDADDAEDTKEEIINLILKRKDPQYMVQEEDTDVISSEEEDEDDDMVDSPYFVDGIEYMKHWDSEEKVWSIIEPSDYSHMGEPDEDGGVKWVEGAEKLHQGKVRKQ